jgi:uncharacterized membrane protein HdeD (DUF308 family)
VKDLNHTVVVVGTVGIVLIVCLAAIAFLAPSVSPIAMLSVIGAIMIAVLALSLGREFFVRFKVDQRWGTSGELGSLARTIDSGAISGSDIIAPSESHPKLSVESLKDG